MIQDDITRLVKKPPAEKKLDPAKTPDAIRAQRGFDALDGGQIASPLTETDRTHYASRTATTSDGVFSFAYSPIETVVFSDAKGHPVVLQFTDPA